MAEPNAIIAEYLERRSKVFWQDVRSHANAERACSLDYHGRFLYELLQNAVDRADHLVRIHLDRANGQLLFGNDGERFTIHRQDDADRLSDFHALCSIHTSSKSAAESIGNKGVGVKSVWEVADRLSVWSSDQEHGWWGFRLHNPLQKTTIRENADEESKHLLSDLLTNPQIKDPLPSFYFPEPHSPPKGWPRERFDGCKTVLHLDWDPTPERTAQVERRLDEFCKRHFFFVGAKKGGEPVEIAITRDGEEARSLSTDSGHWTLVRASEVLPDWAERKEKRIAAARELGLSLDSTDVIIAFPPPGQELEPEQALFYSYLPTEVPCGFSVLIHADFFLDNSRKAIDFGKELNARLVQDAAEVMVRALADPQLALGARSGAWRFLDPSNACQPLASEIKELLFANQGLDSFATVIARRSFGEGQGRPAMLYEYFYAALRGWLSRTRKADERKEMLRHFRHEEILCVPLSEGEEGTEIQKAVALPDVDSRGSKKRKSRTIFFRKQRSDDGQAAGPMKSLGVFAHPSMDRIAVSDWQPLRDISEQLKLTEFERDAVVKELATDVREAAGDPELHELVLKFLWELLADRKNTGSETRFDGREPLSIRCLEPEGESLGPLFAAFHVPVKSGRWARADQAYFGDDEELSSLLRDTSQLEEVDIARVREIGIEPTASFTVERFLRLLGVWACVPLKSSAEDAIIPVPLESELTQEQRKTLARCLSKHWDLYRRLPPARFKGLVDGLRETAWFPLSADRNIGADVSEPQLVWRVETSDRSKAEYYRKYADTDLELDDSFLASLGIVHEGPSASREKLLAQLAFMREKVPNPREMSDSSPFRSFAPRYRALMLLLSRQSDTEEMPGDIPLLYEESGKLYWREKDSPPDTIWFYNQPTKRRKNQFRDLRYAVLEHETREWLVRHLGLRRFAVTSTLCGHHEPDDEAQRRLDEALPAFLSIVESIRPGGRVEEDFGTYLERWSRMEVRHGVDVYQRLEVGEIKREDGKNRSGDVIVDERITTAGTEVGGRLVHDIPREDLDRELERFAEPIARLIFRNVLYSEYFARVLQVLSDEDAQSRIEEYLQSRDVDDETLHRWRQAVGESLLSDGQIEELRGKVERALSSLAGQEIDLGDANPTALRPEHLPKLPGLTAGQVNEALKDLGLRLEARSENVSRWRSRKKEMRWPVLVACFQRNEHELGAEGSDDLLRAYDELTPTDEQLDLLDFPSDEPLRGFLRDHGVSTDEELDEWSAEVREWPSYQSIRMWIEYGLKFSTEEPQPTKARSAEKPIEPARSRPTKSKDVKARQREQAAKHARGLSAERYFVLSEAHRLCQAWDEAKWRLIQQELERINGELKGALETAKPDPRSVEAVANRLHVARYVDGVGYDALTVDDDGRLQRVEIKSSSSGGQFYLSDAELREAKKYLEQSNDVEWRLRLYVQEGAEMRPYDATDTLREALLSYEPPEGLLRPTEYLVKVGLG